MKILQFNWAAMDVKAGTKYVIGVAVVIAFSLVIEFSWFAVGCSAVLAWLTNIPGPRRQRLTGVALFIGIGAILVGLVYFLSGTYWPWLVSMVVIAFIGTFAMIEGLRGFMVGWCLICWFYVLPLLGTGEMPLEILSAHLLGGLVVFILVAIPLGEKIAPKDHDKAPESSDKPSVPFVASYAATVAIVMTIGVALGDLWLKSDPTLILQASLMIILPSVAATWIVAVDRMIGLIAGVVIGFYLGQFAGGGLTLEIIVWLVASFLLVTLMYVNAAPKVFFFVLTFSLVWGTLEGEAGHAMANERIIAELVGVVLAGVAVSMRSTLARMFAKPPRETASDSGAQG
jgi:hypothetical protein